MTANGNVFCTHLRKAGIYVLTLLAWTAAITPGASAQTRTVASASVPASNALHITLGQAIVPLTGPWKFHTGDNPRWADANFNDEDWQTMDLTPPAGSVDPGLGTSGYIPGWTAKGHPEAVGYAWYRLRVYVSGDSGQLALLMPIDVDDGYQVYCNGHLLGAFGDFSVQRPRTYYGQPMIFRLPLATADETAAPGAAREIVLALRFYMKPADLIEDPTPGGLHGPPQLGSAVVAQAYYTLQRSVLARTYNLYSIPILVFLLAGLAALTLYMLDRRDRVFLWLGAAALSNVLYMTFTLSAILTTLISDRLIILRPLLLTLVLWAWLMAWYVWFDLGQMRWLRRLIYSLAALQMALQIIQAMFFGRGMNPAASFGPWDIASRAVNLLLGLVPLIILYYGWRQRKREGKWAAFALILFLLALFPRPLVWLHIPLIWFAFGVQISTRLVLELVVSLWLLLLLILRFQLSQQVQQQLQNEMHQAQQIQQTLLPEAPATLPGFHIESMYRPAAEVGGDFFQILPSTDGGLLVVIGDVSGKGLRAAMLVSLIIGTLRTLAEQDLSPGKLLEGLNRRLHKRMEGGFATCVCARITPDGKMTLANAGHLAPYLDGVEVEVPTDLPMGIITGIDYEERSYVVPPGSRLVFMTDGIVEARNKNGELYGFDRTAILARETIAEIVRTAQHFGQEDDITVVGLIREGSSAPAHI
ncbi:MAG TPA: SpoIIE family protein phosphatase [Acidobacteriaceae bacterium]|jgi:hypothetical protein|nr:SpoIIE family protein phosphatase [Acidobacteriaceae bacterium]